MQSVVSAITRTIPISQFNRGRAGQIFEEVKRSGAKIVMKNNTAECVLISPEEYLRLMDELNDARLLTLANERMQTCDAAALLDEAEVNRRLDITEADLENADGVAFE